MTTPPDLRLSRLMLRTLEISTLLSLISAILVLVRVVTVARGDVEYAYLLLANANFAAILSSTLLIIAPGIIALALACLSYYLGRKLGGPPLANKAWLQILSIVCLMLFLGVLLHSLSPGGFYWELFFVLMILIVALAKELDRTANRFWKNLSRWLHAPGRGRFHRINVALIASGTYFILLVISLLGLDESTFDRPWAPSEALDFGESAVVARVLGGGSDWLLIAEDEPRNFYLVPSGSVERRWTCVANEELEEYESRLLPGISLSNRTLSFLSCDEALELILE